MNVKKLVEFLQKRIEICTDDIYSTADNRQKNFHRGQVDAYEEILEYAKNKEDEADDDFNWEDDLKDLLISKNEDKR